MFLKKTFMSTNTRNKCITRKINLYFFFDVTKNGQIFPSKVCHFQYNFLFSREIGNVTSCKEVRLKKLMKFRLLG